MISIPGIVTFKNSKPLQEALKIIPLDRMMVETDGPWLAPVPKRGKTNYPYYVEYVAADIANKLNVSLEEFAEQLTKNSINFLKSN